MSENINPFEYDEDEAVKYIQNHLPQDVKGKFSDDNINYVIDVVYDFYDEKGFMDDDASDEDTVEVDEDELIEYVLKNIRKDKIGEFSRDEITYIIRGELEYCESLGMFE